MTNRTSIPARMRGTCRTSSALGRITLDRKYPDTDTEWGWQWVFPASHLGVDPRSGVKRRHHLHDSVPQHALKEAAR